MRVLVSKITEQRSYCVFNQKILFIKLNLKQIRNVFNILQSKYYTDKIQLIR